ncbi:MAG: type II secretion system GspH family protein [Acidobacteriota bacterium]|jgi:prepilin-type N-terminal cleavage/methylation domain-containing protein|nr:type II secretion system GspH family protein [Acidobacteriota bacterium]
MRPKRTAWEAAGFTLFEVLVAITILAIGVALAASLIGRSIGNIRKIEARSRIIEHANSVMELTLLDQEITEPTTFDGDFADGTRWTMNIEEYTPDDAELLEQVDMPVKLLAYTVEMFPPGSGVVDFRLRTLKLVPAR